jgi:hypothetical protein
MLRYAFGLCLVVSVLLSFAFALESENQPFAHHIKGVWVTRILGEHADACGDGNRVWTWDGKKLYVVDRWATCKQVWALPEEGSIEKVLPAGPVGDGENCQAWVVAEMPKRLFRIETSGNSSEYKELRGNLDSVFTLKGTRGYAWVSTATDPVVLHRLMKGEGTVLCPVPQGLGKFRVLPAGNEGEEAWLIADGGARLYYIGKDGAVKKDYRGELADFRVLGPPAATVSGVQDSVVQDLWIETGQGDQSRLYRVTGGQDPVPFPALDGISISNVFPIDGQRGSAWVQPMANDGLLLLRRNQEPQVLLQPEKQSEGPRERVETLVVSRDGKHAWAKVKSGRQIYFLGADRGEEPYMLLFEDKPLGDVLSVESMFPAQDQEHVWAKDEYGKLHLLSRTTKLKSFDLEKVTDVFPNIGDKDRAWVSHEEGDRLHFVEEDGVLTSHALNSKRSESKAFYAADSKHGWITTGKGIYCFGYDNREDIDTAALKIGDTEIDLNRVRAVVSGNPREGELIDFKLKSHENWLRTAPERKGQIHVSIIQPGHEQPAARAEVPPQGKREWALRFSPEPKIRYQVSLTLEDDLGSNFQIAWPDVTFPKPWWEEKWLATLIAYLGIVALAIVTLLLFRPVPVVSSWSPLVCWLLGGAAPWLFEAGK